VDVGDDEVGLELGQERHGLVPLLTAVTSKSSSMKVNSMTFWMVTLSSASRMRRLMNPPWERRLLRRLR